MERGDPHGVARPLRWMWANLFKGEALDAETIRESLRRIPLFQELTPKDLSRIEECLYLRRYRAEEFVFREGEPGLGMYIIHRGSVWIQRSQPGEGDALAPILELGKGDFFGEMALLEEVPHIVSARARSNTELLGFFRPDFLTLVHYHPRLGSRLLLGLGRVIAIRFRAAIQNAEPVP